MPLRLAFRSLVANRRSSSGDFTDSLGRLPNSLTPRIAQSFLPLAACSASSPALNLRRLELGAAGWEAPLLPPPTGFRLLIAPPTVPADARAGGGSRRHREEEDDDEIDVPMMFLLKQLGGWLAGVSSASFIQGAHHCSTDWHHSCRATVTPDCLIFMRLVASSAPAIELGGGETMSVSTTTRCCCADVADAWVPRMPSPEHGTTLRLNTSPEACGPASDMA